MPEGILAIIGHTPLVELRRLFSHLPARIFAKLEQFNPGGSAKDRPALHMIERALANGEIGPGSVIIESSSGNLGIGLAQVCIYYNLRLIIVVDPKTTEQNISLLKAFNAEVEMVHEPDRATGEFLPARIKRVKELLALHANSYWPNQYANEYNAGAHQQTMHEVTQAFNGNVDYLFCATSTCGTLRGCAEYKRKNRLRTKIVAVDAVGSVIFGGQKSKRLIPGHGAAIVPALYENGLADDCIHVTDRDCVIGCQRLVHEEAILGGGSSGAVISAIEQYSSNLPDSAICVAILADRGERYLDTVFNMRWIEQHFGDISHCWKARAETHSCVSAAD